MAALEPLMTIKATLHFNFIGDVGAGTRLDVPFDGVATSPHWEGELPVNGVDYVTVKADGTAELVIRGRVGEGKRFVSYQARGRQTREGIIETLDFTTNIEELSFLNQTMAVAIGGAEKDQLTLEVYSVKR